MTFNNNLNERAELSYSLLPEDSANIIDIGCSDGTFTNSLYKKGRKIFGIDTNEKSIASASKKFRNVKFLTGSAERLPFKDNYFDTAFLMDVLEHVENEKRVIAEVYRVLKPGGLLIITVPHQGAFKFLDAENIISKFISLIPKKIVENLVLLRKGERYYPERKCHKHYTTEELKFLTKKFSVSSIYLRGLFIYPLCHLFQTLLGKKTSITENLIRFDYRIEYGKLSYCLAMKLIAVKN